MRKTVLRAFLAKLLVGVAAPCAAQMFPQDTGPTYFPVQQTATNYVTVDGAGDLDVNVGSAVISNGDLIISSPSLGIRFGDNSLLTTGNVGATSDTNTWTGGNTFVGVSTFSGAVALTNSATFSGAVLGAGFQNIQIFTSTGSTYWTVPSNVYHARFLACGAGGGGGSAQGCAGQAQQGAGGGAGACYFLVSTTTPGASIEITIGAGGAGSSTNEVAGSAGASSYIDVNGSTITIAAGTGGGYSSCSNGADGGGGSGGGCGTIPSPFSGFCIIGNGGTGAHSTGSTLGGANCSGQLGGASPFFGGVPAAAQSSGTSANSGSGAGGDGGCTYIYSGIGGGGNGGNGIVVILY